MERYPNGDLQREGSSLVLEVERPVTLEAAPGEVGCVYYEAGLRGLVGVLGGAKGAVEHVRGTVRGEGGCAWRADWRKVAHDDGSGS